MDEIDSNVLSCLTESHNVATSITSLSLATNTVWPFFTDTNFHVTGQNFRFFSDAENVAIAPLVPSEELVTWELYSQENQQWIQDGFQWEYETEGTGNNMDQQESSLSPITGQVFSIHHGQQVPSNTSTANIFAPVWQTSKVPSRPNSLVNFDALSNPTFERVFRTVQTYDEPVLS